MWYGIIGICSRVRRARDRASDGLERSRDRQGPDPRTIVKHAEKQTTAECREGALLEGRLALKLFQSKNALGRSRHHYLC